MPACDNEAEILSWIEQTIGIDVFRTNTIRAMRILLQGNDGHSVTAILRQCFPEMAVTGGPGGSCVFIRPPRIKHYADSQHEPDFESKILYEFDLVVMRQFALMRTRMASVLACVTEEEWIRRSGQNRDVKGVAGEVLLDALVKASLDDIQKQLPTAHVQSITDLDTYDRSSLEDDINDLLRWRYRFSVDKNGCFLYSGHRLIREYEHVLVANGDEGPALLLLDATTGATDGKLAKAIAMKDRAIPEDMQRNVHAISIAFDRRYDAYPHKLILPFAHGINALVASRKAGVQGDINFSSP